MSSRKRKAEIDAHNDAHASKQLISERVGHVERAIDDVRAGLLEMRAETRAELSATNSSVAAMVQQMAALLRTMELAARAAAPVAGAGGSPSPVARESALALTPPPAFAADSPASSGSVDSPLGSASPQSTTSAAQSLLKRTKHVVAEVVAQVYDEYADYVLCSDGDRKVYLRQRLPPEFRALSADDQQWVLKSLAFQVNQNLASRKTDFTRRVHVALAALLASAPLVAELLRVQPLTVVAKHVLFVMVTLRDRVSHLDVNTRIGQLRTLSAIYEYVSETLVAGPVSKKARGQKVVEISRRVEALLAALKAAEPRMDLAVITSRFASDQLELVTPAAVDDAKARAAALAVAANANANANVSTIVVSAPPVADAPLVDGGAPVAAAGE